MKILILVIVGAVGLLDSRAAEVLVKQLTIAVPQPGNVGFREFRYYVSEELAAKLPQFDPEGPASYLLPTKALAIAFDFHFSPRGIPKARYYREAQVSLEKVDDYSQSAVAKGVREKSAACRNLWFYIVSCGRPKFGDDKLGPAPILVLMDGSTVVPKEEMKRSP